MENNYPENGYASQSEAGDALNTWHRIGRKMASKKQGPSLAESIDNFELRGHAGRWHVFVKLYSTGWIRFDALIANFKLTP